MLMQHNVMLAYKCQALQSYQVHTPGMSNCVMHWQKRSGDGSSALALAQLLHTHSCATEFWSTWFYFGYTKLTPEA